MVCRPEYFSVYPKPFKTRSAVVSDEQPICVCLVRTSAIVPLSGYQDGKVVKSMAGDFNGDRVLASGPGAGALGQAEALTDDTDEKHDLSAAGALEGTFDELALRCVVQVCLWKIVVTKLLSFADDICVILLQKQFPTRRRSEAWSMSSPGASPHMSSLRAEL